MNGNSLPATLRVTTHIQAATDNVDLLICSMIEHHRALLRRFCESGAVT